MLALVFTITLIAAQIAGRYTAITKVLKEAAILLMLLFAAGVILPIILLRAEGSPGNGSVDACIALAIVCTFSLIPYLLRMNTILKYDFGIDNLAGKAVEAIASLNEPLANNLVAELIELGLESIKKLRGIKKQVKFMKAPSNRIVDSLAFLGRKIIGNDLEQSCREVMKGLSRIAKESARIGKGDLGAARLAEGTAAYLGDLATTVATKPMNAAGPGWGNSIRAACSGLQQFSIQAIEGGAETMAVENNQPSLAMNGLDGLSHIEASAFNSNRLEIIDTTMEYTKDIGMSAAEKGFDHPAEMAIVYLKTSAERAMDKMEVLPKIAEWMAEIGIKAYQHSLVRAPNRAAEELWLLGIIVQKKSPSNRAHIAKPLGDLANVMGRDTVTRACIYLKGLGLDIIGRFSGFNRVEALDSLDQFKKYYEESAF